MIAGLRAPAPAAVAAGRDRSIDTLRPVAIAGVVCGHWLVTGLVVDEHGAWRQASPLAAMPGFTPVSWVLQTLGLFFFAGGFAAARSTRGFRPAAGLARAVGVLLALWATALGCAAALGVPAGTLRTIAVLVVSPLWFLLPYLFLRAATRPLVRCVDRFGPLAAVAPAVAVVAASDAHLAPSWAAVPSAWSVPWVLGIAAAGERRDARAGHRAAPGLLLLIAGIGAMAVLVRFAGYPASAVGVPGQGRSNLNPPSLLAVALAAAQIGLFLLIRAAVRGPIPAAGHARAPNGRLAGSLNRAALPIYLGHQSVLVVVAVAGRAITPNGLLTPPDDPSWIMHRVAWLPVLVLVLAVVTSPRWWTTRRARDD
jgi:hypothetical protein